jgi:outer membrane protein
MKKITFLALISLLTFSLIAQNKFGHINKQEVFLLMPEAKTIQQELEKFSKTLEAQLTSMTAEIQQMQQEYQSNETTYTDLVKQDKEAEIEGLYLRIQTFQQNAQQSLQAKEQELIEPVENKVNQAIKDVAKEGGYIYIFEKGTLHFSNESNNILPLVKKKLKL